MNTRLNRETATPEEFVDAAEGLAAEFRAAKERHDSGELSHREVWKKLYERIDELQTAAAFQLKQAAPNVEEILETQDGELDMNGAERVLATIDMPVGHIERSGSQSASIRLQPFNSWFGQINKAIRQIHKEISSKTPILHVGGSLVPLEEPFNDEMIAALGALITQRSEGRLHIMPVAEELRQLLRQTA